MTLCEFTTQKYSTMGKYYKEVLWAGAVLKVIVAVMLALVVLVVVVVVVVVVAVQVVVQVVEQVDMVSPYEFH